MKRYLKSLGYVALIIIIGTLFFTTLHFFNIIGDKVMNIVKIIIPIIGLGFGSIHYGKKQMKESLKLGIPIILMFLFISLIFFFNDLTWKNLIYYLVLTLVIILPNLFKSKTDDI